MTEGHKITLKPEIPSVPWMMLEKCCNRTGNAQKSSVTKWKQFLQGLAGGGEGGQ